MGPDWGGPFKKRVKDNNVLGVGGGLTLNDVTQALSVEQVLQAGNFLLQLTHQSVVGVLVDDSVAADLLGTVSVPAFAKRNRKRRKRRGDYVTHTYTHNLAVTSHIQPTPTPAA